MNGDDCRRQPYKLRIVALSNMLLDAPVAPNIQFVETQIDSAGKHRLFKRLVAQKREGAVFKQLDAPHTPGRPNGGGSQLKHKFCATLSAVVSKINPQRSVELRLFNSHGWHVVGNVTIPANHRVPKVCTVVDIRYLYAFAGSRCLYQPVYLGERKDVEEHECVISQLKFKSGEDEG